MHTHHNRYHIALHITLLLAPQVFAFNDRQQKVYDVVIEKKEQKKLQQSNAYMASGLLVGLAFPSCLKGAMQ